MPRRSFCGTAARWDFDVGTYIDRFVPAPTVLRRLPVPVAWFLGARPPVRPGRPGRPAPGSLVVVAWAFVGALAGVMVVMLVLDHIPALRARNAAAAVGSIGASAVLEFYAIESPLSQPRNAVLGQLLSAVVGVGVGKLFALAGDEARFESLRWIAGGLACAAATALMALTGTVHPPGGATALGAVISDGARHIGWWLLPAVLLSAVLVQVVALLVNNVQRRYPLYWWSPRPVGQFWQARPAEVDAQVDAGVDAGVDAEDDKTEDPEGGRTSYALTQSTGPSTGPPPAAAPPGTILVSADGVYLPDGLGLALEERAVLESLMRRL